MQQIQKEDKRRARGIETRRLILQSAISTIASLGLGNTTLTRVAERIGVSHTLVVFHFKSKNLLIQEALDFLGKRYGEGWDAALAEGGESAMDKLLNLVNYDIQFACENPEYVSAWHAFWGEAKGNVLYREHGIPRDNRYKNEMRSQISKIVDEGGYDKQELPLIINGLNAMLFGLWTESHLIGETGCCDAGKAAIQLFLAKVFPDQPLPAA